LLVASSLKWNSGGEEYRERPIEEKKKETYKHPRDTTTNRKSV